jgi:predicted TPR repeat methyltransferase
MVRTLAVLSLLVAASASAQTPPPATVDKHATVDQLFTALKGATTQEQASELEARIAQSWLNAGTPSITLLMSRGVRDVQGGLNEDAVEDFDAIVTLEPSLPEGWHRRALAKLAVGDTDGAVADLGETLALEPRHFMALSDLSRIAEHRGDWKSALAAWQKVLEIDPKTEDGEERLKVLTSKALGEEL